MKKSKRLTWLLVSLSLFFFGVGLIVIALNENIVFFKTPSQLYEEKIEIGSRLRLGGLVERGSFTRVDNEIKFTLTDFISSVFVSYKGVLPDLFREGQCVVLEGLLVKKLFFVADRLFAKHDENYLPKEISDTLKQQGNWQLYANCLDQNNGK